MNPKPWPFLIRPDTQDAMMVHETFVHNEYHLPDGMEGWRVLDLGGYIGSFAAACLVRGAKVESWEPNPFSFDLLVENVGGHGVRCRNQAVSDRHEMLRMYCHPYWTACAKIVRPSPSDLTGRSPPEGPERGRNMREVAAQSLDSILLRSTGIGAWNLVKMDVEGSEEVILKGTRHLGRLAQEVVGEAHPIEERTALDVARSCCRLLRGMGFQASLARKPASLGNVYFHGILPALKESRGMVRPDLSWEDENEERGLDPGPSPAAQEVGGGVAT